MENGQSVENDLHGRLRAIRSELTASPLKALQLYEAGLRVSSSPIVAAGLQAELGDTMNFISAGSDVGTRRTLAELAELSISASSRDRERMLAAAVDRLIAFGVVADASPGSKEEQMLRRIGKASQSTVLGGAVHQELCAKLAIRLALRRLIPIPFSVVRLVGLPLIEALIMVLRVGSGRVRDLAIEGIGALLRHVDDPAEVFPRERPSAAQLEEGDWEINTARFSRLERDRMLALAVAGDREALATFTGRIAMPLSGIVDRARTEQDPAAIEAALYERSVLLRTLPAICRHADDADRSAAAVEWLRDAAEFDGISGRDAPGILIAWGRYRESVFRAIDVFARQSGKSAELDRVVGNAVAALPRTMVGTAVVCNAQIRATISTLRTAARVVQATGSSSRTKEALRPLFVSLGTRTPWSNPGIVEGCYSVLARLLPHEEHADLTAGALAVLFADLGGDSDSEDFVALHRRLVAAACFRKIVLFVAEEGRSDRDVQTMLRATDPQTFLAILHQDSGGAAGALVPAASHDVSEIVLSSIAFESELLRRSAPLFRRWADVPAAQQVLLTRILAAQLHAVSRQFAQISRHRLPREVFLETPTVAIGTDEATRILWERLSSLHPETAEAVDVEIRNFADLRGRRQSGASAADLPGWVLAMVSSDVNARIAAQIASAIDLNLRQARADHADVDVARVLYQIALNGPHESVFDHLLPRLYDPHDRALVLLFRNYVRGIRSTAHDGAAPDDAQLSHHINDFLHDIAGTTSPTLHRLGSALKLYLRLVAEEASVWMAIRDGKVAELFDQFDQLASPYESPTARRPLLHHPIRQRLIDLQSEVGHYLDLPIGDFSGREEALSRAGHAVLDIETTLAAQEGLQAVERIPLFALMQRLRDLFQRTIRWYCAEPARRRAARDKEGFRLLFIADSKTLHERIRSMTLLASGESTVSIGEDHEAEVRVARLRAAAGSQPPPFPGQQGRFEEYFVAWLSSDFDVDSLERALRDRWPVWFRFVFGTITSLQGTSFLILFPCAIAIGAHAAALHWMEGLGFFLIAAVVLGGAALSVTRLPTLKRIQDSSRDRPRYWFPSLLPRLAPIAVIAEYDNSYDLPLKGSSWTLALLMFFAFRTAQLVARRAVAHRSPQRPVSHGLDESRGRQIVALALSYSFAIAVVVSIFVVDNHVSPGNQPVDHTKNEFLGVLPREARLDFVKIAGSLGRSLPKTMEAHARFVFYPTVILVWTALGLFSGVIIEGLTKDDNPHS